MAWIQVYLPYLLPMAVLLLNEIVAHNPSISSNSLLQLIISTVMGALKGAIASNPEKPLP